MSPAPTLAALQAQLECVTREVARRAREYQGGRAGLSAPAACALVYDLAIMQGVAQTLRGLIEARQLPLLAPSDRTP